MIAAITGIERQRRDPENQGLNTDDTDRGHGVEGGIPGVESYKSF